MSDLIAAIRAHTAQLHEQVEQSYPFCKMMSDSLNEEDYTRVLRCLAQWHHIIETTVAPVILSTLQGHVAFSSSVQVLKQDLQAMGADKCDILALNNDHFDNNERALGALYVVLGSANGATHILRHLQKHHSTLPSAFYKKSALDISQWKQYMRWLATQEEQFSNQQIADIICGAKEAFTLLLAISTEVKTSQRSRTLP
ncbi:biliverdin-producing heme oxygenase [Pseudoalteromonas sp. SSDWG2]|uniref:biliverdin-producing heme oxygenase n=1 Tax=Pseudoalteromonas sp. SSDWG2 TaxID=3139391 RepID=UPI003BAC4EB0